MCRFYGVYKQLRNKYNFENMLIKAEHYTIKSLNGVDLIDFNLEIHCKYKNFNK